MVQNGPKAAEICRSLPILARFWTGRHPAFSPPEGRFRQNAGISSLSSVLLPVSPGKAAVIQCSYRPIAGPARGWRAREGTIFLHRQNKRPGGRGAATMAVFFFGLLAVNYAQYQLSPLGPEITAALGLNAAQFSSAFSAPMIPAFLLSFFAGALSDRWGCLLYTSARHLGRYFSRPADLDGSFRCGQAPYTTPLDLSLIHIEMCIRDRCGTGRCPGRRTRGPVWRRGGCRHWSGPVSYTHLDVYKRQGEDHAEEVTVYTCPSCGAQILTDRNTTATFCVFCHNPAVIAGRLEGAFRPAYVLPFVLKKEHALQALEGLCKKKPLLPRDFTATHHIEKLSGLYAPFWLFDCQVDASLSARAERITSWSDSSYRYTCLLYTSRCV